jgi:CheY-like chemotaxis protein
MQSDKPSLEVRATIWVILILLMFYVISIAVTGRQLPVDQSVILCLTGVVTTVAYSYYKRSDKNKCTNDRLVLLIEDEHDQAVSLQIQLAKEGLNRIIIANTGEQALQMLRNEARYGGTPRPDCILLDMGLPGMSGQQFNKIIKSDPSFCDIPVIALTGLLRFDQVPDNDLLQFCFAFIEKGRGAESIARTVYAAINGEKPPVFLESRFRLPWDKQVDKSKAIQKYVHNQRNNIGGIKGICILMQQTSLTPEQKEYLAHVDSACEKALTDLSAYVEEAFL